MDTAAPVQAQSPQPPCELAIGTGLSCVVEPASQAGKLSQFTGTPDRARSEGRTELAWEVGATKLLSASRHCPTAPGLPRGEKLSSQYILATEVHLRFGCAKPCYRASCPSCSLQVGTSDSPQGNARTAMGKLRLYCQSCCWSSSGTLAVLFKSDEKASWSSKGTDLA